MNENELHQRKDRIFEIIVQAYIQTAEPVGSRTISRNSDLGLSAASIRNVMADLEEMGYLAQPHTSAGRIPTDKGYRYYVDSLMKREDLGEDEKRRIVSEIESARSVQAMAERASRLISELTGNAALLYLQNLRRLSFLSNLLDEISEQEKLLSLLEEQPELYVDGAYRVFDQPEFNDRDKIRQLLRAFDQKEDFVQVFVKDLGEEGVQIHIGRENEADGFDGLSLVVKDCHLDRTPIGGVAVVGPTRMRYSRIISVVDYVADSLAEALRRF